MEERRSDAVLVAENERLSARVERLTQNREDSQTKLLEDHSKTLSDMQKTLVLLVEQTKDLPELGRRVSRLETWKVYLAGIASAFTFIGTIIGGTITFFMRR